jgi:glycosyltransferase involved in cell wall biosynthesis
MGAGDLIIRRLKTKHKGTIEMPEVLMWGRMERNYARNRIITKLFEALDWEVRYFHPVSSHLGLIQAFLSKLHRPDLIWIPCFRQRDVHSAAFWSRIWSVPTIFDPITSVYEKETYERKKWPPGSGSAERRKAWEKSLFLKVDLVVLENQTYMDFIHREMNIPLNRLAAIYQGAFTDFFKPLPPPPSKPPYEIVFVGSFHPSMGTDVIVEAARQTTDLPCRWVFVGDGDLRRQTEESAKGIQNVVFEGWLDYQELPSRLSKAHILLGIFGTTFKTDFVIPNKVFESMAVAKPLITQWANSYRENVGRSDVIGWVPRGNAQALAETVRNWLSKPEDLPRRGKATRALFDEHFGPEAQRRDLNAILKRVVPNYTADNVNAA